MLIQLVAKFIPGEKQVVFEIPDTLNISDFTHKRKLGSDNWNQKFEISLLSLTVCNNPDHTLKHNREIRTFDYQEQDDIQQPIVFRFPSRPLGTGRRSTIYYRPYLDFSDSDDTDDENIEHVRVRRNIKHVRVPRNIEEEFLNITAGFENSWIITSLKDVNTTPASNVLSRLKQYHFQKINGFFGNIFRFPIQLSIFSDGKKTKITFRIPPNSLFGFSVIEMWQAFSGLQRKGTKQFSLNNQTFWGMSNMSPTPVELVGYITNTFVPLLSNETATVHIGYSLIDSTSTLAFKFKSPHEIQCIADLTKYVTVINESIATIFGKLSLDPTKTPNILSATDRREGNKVVFSGKRIDGPLASESHDTSNLFIRFKASPLVSSLIGITSRNNIWRAQHNNWSSLEVTNETVQNISEQCSSILSVSADPNLYQSSAELSSFFQGIQSGRQGMKKLFSTSTPTKRDAITLFDQKISTFLNRSHSSNTELKAFLEKSKHDADLYYRSHLDSDSRQRIREIQTRIDQSLMFLTDEEPMEVIENPIPEPMEIEESDIIQKKKLHKKKILMKVIQQ